VSNHYIGANRPRLHSHSECRLSPGVDGHSYDATWHLTGTITMMTMKIIIDDDDDDDDNADR
jgi:hypothetical protein